MTVISRPMQLVFELAILFSNNCMVITAGSSTYYC